MVNGRINEEESSVPVKLDLRDQKILSILSRNSRIPISEISKKLSLNRDTIIYKISRMEKLGVINKFYAEINQGLFGYNTCHVFMVIDIDTDKKKYEALLNELKNHPNTKSILEYSDTWDLEWVLLVKDLPDLDKIANQIFSKYSSLILEEDTMVVIKYYATRNLPYEFYANIGYNPKYDKKQKKNINMDDIDFEILRMLAEDSRLTAVDISKAVGLSADAVINRINELYDSDIITRFRILTDRGKLGYHWYTFAVQLKYFDSSAEAKLKELVREHKYIIRCVKTSGTWDLLFYICADTPKNFHLTVKQLKREFQPIIRNSEMWFAYKEHYFTNIPKILSLNDFVTYNCSVLHKH